MVPMNQTATSDKVDVDTFKLYRWFSFSKRWLIMQVIFNKRFMINNIWAEPDKGLKIIILNQLENLKACT